MKNSIILVLILLGNHLTGQEPMTVPSIAIPQNICSCSQTEVDRFHQSVDDALDAAESKYQRNLEDEVDNQKLLENGLKEAGMDNFDYASFSAMSEAQQQAYAMQIANNAMSNPPMANQTKSQKEIKHQLEAGQLETDQATQIQLSLIPIAREQVILEKDADDYYKARITPLHNKLNQLDGPAYNSMLKKINQAEKVYCAQFSPRHLNLIQQEVEGLKRLNPIIKDYLEGKSNNEAGLDLFLLKDADPIIMYLNAISKAFDYRIHKDEEEGYVKMHKNQ
jgi:hypothetical protein